MSTIFSSSISTVSSQSLSLFSFSIEPEILVQGVVGVIAQSLQQEAFERGLGERVASAIIIAKCHTGFTDYRYWKNAN